MNRHPSSTGDFDVARIETLEEFLALEREWDELWRRSEACTPMTSHLLFRSWWECYGTGKRFVAITVREGGALVAAGMFLARRRGPRLFPLRLLRSFGPWHTDSRNALLHLPGRTDALAALLGELSAGADWDALIVGKLDPTWEQFPEIERFFPRRTVRRLRDIARVRISGSFEDFLQSRSRNFRKHLRRAHNKLEAAGGFSIEEYRGPELDEALLERMMAIDLDSWKEDSVIGIAAPERARFFRKFLLGASRAGWSRLYLLRRGEEDAAFCYLMDTEKLVTGFKMSFRKEFAELSPGSLLLERALADSFRAKMRELDFFNYPVGYQQRQWINSPMPQSEIEAYGARWRSLPLWIGRTLAARWAGGRS